ncbi:hypothetical protein B0H13DRAFT_2445856 [Mycena leptocephala]|nr:hypothetical protein B0H13DRAFT_2445856 [Mycena leptocephala]
MEAAWGASQRCALGEALSRALWGAVHKKKGLQSVGTKSTLDLGGPKGREKGRMRRGKEGWKERTSRDDGGGREKGSDVAFSPHQYHFLSSFLSDDPKNDGPAPSTFLTPTQYSSDDRDSGDDSNSVEILTDVTPNSVDSPSNLDVVMLTSLAKPSPESWRRMKYLDWYKLIKPPFQVNVEHEERPGLQTVIGYFKAAPCMEGNPTQVQVDLFRRVSLDTRVNARWTAEEDCAICFINSPPPEILLLCPCRRKVYHQQWHEQGDQNSQRLVQCPTCKHGAKPVHLAWVAPGSAETATCQEKKSKQKHKKGREQKKVQEAARRNTIKGAAHQTVGSSGSK